MGIQFYAYDGAAEGAAVLPEAGADRQVEVAHGNIGVVFEALGMPCTDPYNDDPNWMSAFDMIRRLDRYVAAHPDADPGADKPIDWHPRWPRFVHVGRRPGYLDEKLGELRALAERCARHGWSVAWA